MFNQIAKAAAVLFGRNKKSIITCIAISGVVTTAAMAGAAAVATEQQIADEIASRNDLACAQALNGKDDVEYFESLPVKDAVSLCWKTWIPTVLSGATTIGCIILGNKLRDKELAGMAALTSYKIAELQQYKQAVNDSSPEDIREAIESAFEKNRADAAYKAADRDGNIIDTGHGDVPCIDPVTGQVFLSSDDYIRECLNEFCEELFRSYDGSLPYSRFIELMGGRPCYASDIFKYTADHSPGKFMPRYDGVGEERRPAWVIKFERPPILDRQELAQYKSV